MDDFFQRLRLREGIDDDLPVMNRDALPVKEGADDGHGIEIN